LKEATKEPMYLYLAVLTVCSTVGLQTWQTLFNNFAVEAAGLEGRHIGLIQSIREIPGFLTFLVIYLTLIVKEYRLSALSVLAMAVGLAATGFFPSFAGLTLTTVTMSFGFHYYETTNQSLTLQYFGKNVSPWIFGKLRSLAAASSIGVGLFILVAADFLDYTRLFVAVGALLAAGVAWSSFMDPTRMDLAPQKRHMVFRWKYWLYYFLTFMAGARRQIFMAFAVFLLVKRFDYSVQEVTLLFMINNGINYFLSPTIGRAIIRFGERRVLTLEYASLIIIFAAYAVVQSALLAAVLYILDHVFFNFSIAIRTYFQKVADPGDIAPSMAVGFTINHIAAVVLPALGGFLWMVDYRIPFLAGALLALVSLLAVQRIRT